MTVAPIPHFEAFCDLLLTDRYPRLQDFSFTQVSLAGFFSDNGHPTSGDTKVICSGCDVGVTLALLNWAAIPANVL